MYWNPFKRVDERAGQFRRVHERWLTRAVRMPTRYPRIPIRRVEAGGFSGLLGRPGGDRLAKLWWRRALDRVDLDA